MPQNAGLMRIGKFAHFIKLKSTSSAKFGNLVLRFWIKPLFYSSRAISGIIFRPKVII